MHRRETQHHAAATSHAGLMQRHIRLVTTNLVIAGAHALIRYRVGYMAAMQFLTSIRTTSRLDLVYSDPDLEMQTEELLRRYSDQDFSFTDALSFVVMQQRGIAEAFAYDHHFLTAGFLLVVSATLDN